MNVGLPSSCMGQDIQRTAYCTSATPPSRGTTSSLSSRRSKRLVRFASAPWAQAVLHHGQSPAGEACALTPQRYDMRCKSPWFAATSTTISRAWNATSRLASAFHLPRSPRYTPPARATAWSASSCRWSCRTSPQNCSGVRAGIGRRHTGGGCGREVFALARQGVSEHVQRPAMQRA